MSEPIPPLPPRGEGHKGTFGKLLVVGGSRDMVGAPMLAALAAYRSGCGYVIVAMPRKVLAAALSVVPEVVGLGLEEDGSRDRRLAEIARDADALVIGPGLGKQPDAHDRVAALLEVDQPTVIDADALTGLTETSGWPGNLPRRCVLTPHPGEVRRMTGEDVPTDDDGRIAYAKKYAAQWGRVLLLKGQRTVISDGERVAVNETGDSTLAKAGSGDVLSGVLGTLLAQDADPFTAARQAAHVHGLAGERAGEKWTNRGALARNVCDELPAALATLEG